MFSSFKYQLLLLTLLPPLVIAFALGIYLSYSRLQDIEEYTDARGMAAIRQLSIASSHAMETSDIRLLQAIANASLEEKGLRTVTIFDKSRKLLVHSGPKLRNIKLSRSFFHEKPHKASENNITTFVAPFHRELPPPGTESGRDPEISPDEILGWVAIEYNEDIFIIRRYEAYLIQNTLLLLSLFIASLLGLRLGQRFVNDIGTINNNIKRIREGNGVTPIPATSCKELAGLARHIEEMATTLKTEFDELRQNVELTTNDLRETIETIEIQNIELSLAKKEALVASKIKSEFLANTSHEIRTPLNGILGFTKVLKRTPLSGQQAEYLDTIQKSSENLLAIINDILDFSKIEAGKLELEKNPFNLRQILEDTANLFALSAFEKKIDIVLFIYQDVPLNLIGDSMRITQVVSNLLNNAIKFTKGGTISIRVSLDHTFEDSVGLAIAVSDTGIGMTEQQQKDLFRPFSQANSSTSREYGGTGLGLVISKRLVELMQGEIKVESVVNEGSTFTFTIRVNVSSIQENPYCHQLQGKSVLLIESHNLLNKALQHMIESWGGAVLTSTTTDNAISLLELHHVEAILYGISPTETNKTDMTRVEELAKNLDCPLLLLMPFTSETQPPLSPHICHKPVTETGLFQALSALLFPQNKALTGYGKVQPLITTGTHALVVDDQPANLKLLNVLLGDLGITVSNAHNGQEAVDLCKNRHFDIIFMDVQMPVMNGIDATGIIRHDTGPNQSTPIIAITAHAIASERDALLQNGINDFITKPINERQLTCIIENWCAHGKNSQQPATVDILQSLKLSNNKITLAYDMFTMLVENLEKDMLEITLAYNHHDTEKLLALVHKLHGACCYTGVPSLKSTVKNIEALIKSGNSEQLEASIESLKKVADDLLQWNRQNDFKKLLEQLR